MTCVASHQSRSLGAQAVVAKAYGSPTLGQGACDFFGGEVAFRTYENSGVLPGLYSRAKSSRGIDSSQ